MGDADTFSLIPSDFMCGNGSKIYEGRFRGAIRKHFFTYMNLPLKDLQNSANSDSFSFSPFEKIIEMFLDPCE